MEYRLGFGSINNYGRKIGMYKTATNDRVLALCQANIESISIPLFADSAIGHVLQAIYWLGIRNMELLPCILVQKILK